MTTESHARPGLAENPWFWLMLFGAVGVLGVIVIGPKHAARQARIERMADTRARIRGYYIGLSEFPRSIRANWGSIDFPGAARTIRIMDPFEFRTPGEV